MKNIIFVPTYNESGNIQALIPEIFKYAPSSYVVVVDDNSPDGTADEVLKLEKEYPNLSLLSRKNKEGLGAAYIDAITRALDDVEVSTIITMDADGSHSPEYLPKIYEALKSYDLVVGSRYVTGGGVENWEWWRMMLSRYGNLYARILTGAKVKDLTAGFIGVRRSVLEKIDFNNMGSEGYAYQIEFKFHCAYMLNASFKEIPILFKNRREGESKLSHQIISEGLKTPIRLFFKRFKKK